MSASAVMGIEAVPVAVEVDVSPGLPGMTVVGLPDTTVRESRERVRTAIRNSGFPFPGDRITVSLTPADLRKVGTAFDLPIALGILAAGGVLPHHELHDLVAIGGLSLDGGVSAVRGLLPVAVEARLHAGLICPAANAAEAAIVTGLRVFAASSLFEAAQILTTADPAPYVPASGPAVIERSAAAAPDLCDLRGQLVGRRAVEIAASGGHHLLLTGPPGAGKTMLARRLPGVLPPLSADEALVVTAIHSVAGHVQPGQGLIDERPFRAPHHTCSSAALVGGGAVPRPGELSLAHGGVLFLDELPEFRREVLDTLRQPLETGAVHLSRSGRSVAFPADVTVVAAMNPCPCGYQGSQHRPCRCPPSVVGAYQRRVSGPLRDRFDLFLDLPAVPWADLAGDPVSESSSMVRERVTMARRRQVERQGCLNARLRETVLRQVCRSADPSAEALLERAVQGFGLSARAVTRVLRVARTIADMSGCDRPTADHVAEALHFRAPEASP